MLERRQRSDGSAWENTVSLSRPDRGCTRISSLQVVHLLSLCKGREGVQRAPRWCSQWDLFICKSVRFFSFLFLSFLFFVTCTSLWRHQWSDSFYYTEVSLKVLCSVSPSLTHTYIHANTQFFICLTFQDRNPGVNIQKHAPNALKLCPVKFYWLYIKAFLQTTGQTAIAVDVWNFMWCVCVCVSVCLCVYLIRPTAEDSSLANYTEFSFSSIPSLTLSLSLPPSFPNLPKQTRPFAYCLMDCKSSDPPKWA